MQDNAGASLPLFQRQAFEWDTRLSPCGIVDARSIRAAIDDPQENASRDNVSCRTGSSLRDGKSTREPVESSVSLSSLPELHCRNTAASTYSGITSYHVLSASSRGFFEYVPMWCGSRSFPSTNSAICVLCVWSGLGPFATTTAYSRALQARTKA